MVVFHPPAGADPVSRSVATPRRAAGRRQACDKPTPAESTQTFVKRVVGLPGDHLRIINGHVYRNGVEEHGSYIRPCDIGAFEMHVPEARSPFRPGLLHDGRQPW